MDKNFLYYVNLVALSLVLIFGLGWCNSTSKLQTEKASHIQDIQTFKNAQKLADDNANKIRKDLEQKAKDESEKADKSYSGLLSQYHTSLLRYKANQSGSVRPGDSKLSTTESFDRPGESPDFSIKISVDDANVCAENTARLQLAHDWAVSLQY